MRLCGFKLHRGRLAAAFFASVCLPCFAAPAWAAGYALKEYSLSGMATAFAGTSAQADGPEFLSFNPATSSGVADFDWSFTINGIYPTSDASFSLATNAFGTPTGGEAAAHNYIQGAYEPGVQLRYRLTDALTAGLSITAPWGLGSDYHEGWAGRYYALESKLLTVNVVPSLAYRLAPDLTLSAGAQIQYARGFLSNAVDFGTIGAARGVPFALPTRQDGKAEFDADGLGLGFVLGALWTPARDVTVGASFRSEVSHKLEGDVDFTLDTAGVGGLLSALSGAFVDSAGSTKLTTPAVGTLGIAVEVSPEVTLLAEATRTWWNVFEELRIKVANPAQGDVFQRYDWEDTWCLSAGLKVRPAERWTLRGGVAFDETPTVDATREPRIPDGDRTWLAFGARYDFDGGTSLEAGYGRLWFSKEIYALSAAAPENLVRGNLNGHTDTVVDVFTVQLTFR